jgi:hypothetical protein
VTLRRHDEFMRRDVGGNGSSDVQVKDAVVTVYSIKAYGEWRERFTHS